MGTKHRSRVEAGLLCLALVAFVPAACGGGGETTANAEAAPAAGVAPAGDSAAAPAAPAAAEDDDRPVAPDFELPDLSGESVTLSGLRGKTVVIDFWATWCPPCIFQIPILNAIQARHRDSDVVVVGIAVDTEGAEVVKPYAEENGIEYTIVIGDEGLARKFGAPGFPALAIVSPNGRIDSMHVGLIEEEDLEAAIAKVRGG